MQRVLGVAQINPVEIPRDLAFDDGEVVGIPFGGLRPPRAGPVRVVIVFGQCRQELADDLNIHQNSFAEPTTKLTVVAVLPPKFNVPNVFAPST